MKSTTLSLCALMLLSALSLGSCFNSSSDSSDAIDYLPVKESDNSKWGFVGPDGKIVLSEEFKNEPSAVVNGFFYVKENDGFSLYKMSDNPKVLGDCEGLYDVGLCVDGLIPITRPKQRISIVDTNGKTKFTLEPIKGKEIVKASGTFSDGMLLFETEDDKLGFVNTSGKVVIEPKYDGATEFKDGFAIAVKNGKDDENAKYFIIDKSGKEVVTLRKGIVPRSNSFYNGYFTAKDSNDHILFIDSKGEEIKLPSKVVYAEDFNGSNFIFRNEDGDYGVMDKDGEVLLRAKYDGIQRLRDGNFLCNDDDKYVILNKKGDEKNSVDDYKYLFECGKFGFIARDKHTYVMLDSNLKPIKNAEFTDMEFTTVLSSIVRSDYFNIAAAVNDIISMISADGVGKYKLGKGPGAYLSDPSDYLWKSSIDLDDLDKDGYRYKIRVDADFSGTIADYSYDFYSYSYNRNYYWNDVELRNFDISISTETQWGNEGSVALVAAFKEKGFKEDYATASDVDNYAAVLHNNNILVTVSSSKGESSGSVIVFKYDQSIADLIVSNLKQLAKEPSDAPLDEDSEIVDDVLADTVVAECEY